MTSKASIFTFLSHQLLTPFQLIPLQTARTVYLHIFWCYQETVMARNTQGGVEEGENKPGLLLVIVSTGLSIPASSEPEAGREQVQGLPGLAAEST